MSQESPDENGLRKEPGHHVGTQNCPRTGSRGSPGSGMLDPLGPELPLAVLAAIYVVTIWVLQYMPQGVRTALVSQAPISALLILLRPFTGQAAPLTG